MRFWVMLRCSFKPLTSCFCRRVCFNGDFYSEKVIQHRYNRIKYRIVQSYIKKKPTAFKFEINFFVFIRYAFRSSVLQRTITLNYQRSTPFFQKSNSFSCSFKCIKFSHRFESDQLFTATIGMTTENS